MYGSICVKVSHCHDKVYIQYDLRCLLGIFLTITMELFSDVLCDLILECFSKLFGTN